MGREGPERETVRMTGSQTQDPPTATNAATKCQVASAFEHSCWVRILKTGGGSAFERLRRRPRAKDLDGRRIFATF